MEGNCEKSLVSPTNKLVSTKPNYPKDKCGGKKPQRAHRAGNMNCVYASSIQLISNQTLIKTPTDAIFTHWVGKNQKG